MNITQERINEIALECAGLNDSCIDPEHLTVHRTDVVEMFNLFLSRIREEQQVAAEILPQNDIGGRCESMAEGRRAAEKALGLPDGLVIEEV